MKLTQRRIEDLQRPAGRRDMMVFDDEQTGLGVRVTRGAGKGSLAKKFFLAQYRHAGQKRRVPLGSCSAISLAGARDAVRAILGDVAKGRDPAGERKEAARQAKRKAADEALTLAALLAQWEALCLADKRERYAAEAVRAVRVAFEKRLPLPAAELNRAAVVRVLDDLTKDGKVAMASRTAAYGRACYQWAIRRGALEINPFANLPLTPVAKRDRVLSDAELAAVWKATDGPGTFNAIARMLMLTGQRREEVTAMTWDEIVGDLATWIVPASRAKNGAAHLVPLSSQAQAILRVAPRGETGLVFPGRNGPFNGFSKAKEALDKVCGVKDWRLHDLRRTMATGLQRLGVRLEVTEAVLNHVAGSRAGIVGVYQRHSWAEEKRLALTAWGAHVAAIVEGREAASNVTPFHARNALSMRGDRDAEPFVGYRLDDEQRRRVADCTAKDGLRLLSDRFEQLIGGVEESIAHFLLSARGASPRDAHEALRRLWSLIHEGDPSEEALRKLTRALPRRATEYLNRQGPMGIDPEQVDALRNWEPDADPETLMTRVLAAEGAQIVEGRSRGRGRRSGRRIEPIIMGRARGTIEQTHKGGRPESAEEQDLVMFLAVDWLRATNKAPTAGRSDKSGFGDLVHSVFQWVGLQEGTATYALRQYWADVTQAQARKQRENP